MTSAHIIIFTETAQISLQTIRRGRVITRQVERALSVDYLTARSKPLGDHPKLRLASVAGYAVTFRFAEPDEPGGYRYVLDVCLPEDLDEKSAG